MNTDTDTLFNVVIAYEDYEADTRARHMMDRLALQLGTEFRILTDDWKFEMIDDRRLRSHAVQAAAAADMIILAISGDGELPAHIKDWFEQGPFAHERNQSPLSFCTGLSRKRWTKARLCDGIFKAFLLPGGLICFGTATISLKQNGRMHPDHLHRNWSWGKPNFHTLRVVQLPHGFASRSVHVD